MQSSELIKFIRSSLHLSQCQFAKRLGITQQEVSKLENGNCKLTINTLMAICTIYSKPLVFRISENTITPLDDTLLHVLNLFDLLSPDDQKIIMDLLLRLSTNTSF